MCKLFKKQNYLCSKNMAEDTYKYMSTDLARYIVAYANDQRYNINMTKIQKLLYVTYGIYLAVKKERLINEHPQAWPYGPVFPTTRNKLLREDFECFTIKDPRFEAMNEDNELQSLLKIVFDSFGGMTATTLSSWSHQPDSPWDKTRKTVGFKWGKQIPDEYIKEFFSSLIISKS